MNALFLAFAWLRWTPVRTGVFIIVGAVILAVPMVTRLVLADAQTSLGSRALQTPLVLGPRGSQLDLAMSALYFSDSNPPSITRADEDAIWESGLGLPIPLHTAFRASGFPVVGTSLDYFDFRGLQVVAGRKFAVLGEVVLGAEVAKALGLKIGDKLLSSADNLFDLDGSYPLEMTVVGILAATGSSDDEATFTDVKTAWVIEGIGHGHDDVVLSGSVDDQAALASVREFQVITNENIDSFHFHGEPESYPLSAIIVVPNDLKSSTLLRGRYLDATNPVQIIVPKDVIQALIARIFRIATLVDAVAALAGLSALVAMALALYLSWSLRSAEMGLAKKIGAGRWTILRIALSEVAILVLCSSIAALSIAMLFHSSSKLFVQQFITL